METKTINSKTFVRYKEYWVPIEEFISLQKDPDKPTFYTGDAIEQIIEENAFLTKKVDMLQESLKKATDSNSKLYSEIDRCKRALREVANGGAVLIDKNGNVKFPDIRPSYEQHRDNTPGEMVETFRGIYEVWECHPELEFMELISKLINNRRGNVPIDDEEFISALKEVQF